MAGPPRLTTALVSPRAMISRRRLCFLDVAGEALAQGGREIAGRAQGSSPRLVGHAAFQRYRAAGRSWRSSAARPAPAARGRARARALLQLACRRAAPRARGRTARAPPASASAADSRQARARCGARPGSRPGTAGSCCAARRRRRPRSSAQQRVARLRASRPAHRRRQRDLDVDLLVGGVDAGRVVDGVGVDAPAARARTRCAPRCVTPRLAPSPTTLARTSAAVDAHAHRWRGRRPRRRSRRTPCT